MDPHVPFHALSVEDALAKLDTAPTGLSASEAEKRSQTYGANLLPRKKGEGPLQLLWTQINDPLIWVLVGSAAIAIVADPEDGLKNGLVILAVVVLNTLIGFAQEYRAGQAIESLTQMVPESATVFRDGKKTTVPSSALVPGDVILLASGDKAPPTCESSSPEASRWTKPP